MLPTLLLLLVSYAKCELLDEYDLVDLTYEQDSEAKGWPTFEKFEWNLLFAEEKGVPGQWWVLKDLYIYGEVFFYF